MRQACPTGIDDAVHVAAARLRDRAAAYAGARDFDLSTRKDRTRSFPAQRQATCWRRCWWTPCSLHELGPAGKSTPLLVCIGL
jgi:hypothetical protein